MGESECPYGGVEYPMDEPLFPDIPTEPPYDQRESLDKVFGWIGKAIFGTLALLVIGYIILFNVALLWIKYQPLPTFPHRNVAYTVTDTGKTVSDDFWFESRDPRKSHSGGGYSVAKTFYRLSANGGVTVLTESEGITDLDRRAETLRTTAKRLGIKHGEYGDRVIDVARNGYAFARNGQDSRVYRGKKPGVNLPRKVRGYRWDHHCGTAFFAVNGRGEVVGNERIATACASSGGTSEPHGRYLPLLWRGGNSLPEDMNTLISRSGGWYLYHALDLNERGQILCLAAKSRVRDAETHPKVYRLVVLSPIRVRPPAPNSGGARGDAGKVRLPVEQNAPSPSPLPPPELGAGGQTRIITP